MTTTTSPGRHTSARSVRVGERGGGGGQRGYAREVALEPHKVREAARHGAVARLKARGQVLHSACFSGKERERAKGVALRDGAHLEAHGVNQIERAQVQRRFDTYAERACACDRRRYTPATPAFA